MKNKLLLAASLLLVVNAAVAQAPSDNNAQLERGRYLVERVGMCADCHSPRDAKGEFVMELWLKGAALPFQPTVEMPWSPVAPPIAGLPSLSDAEAVKFLTEGTRPDGAPSRPPMPQFRFSAEDAVAVTAYLRSLK